MTKLQAFEQTVKKWKDIIENHPNDWRDTPELCGFCQKCRVCEECPIFEVTGYISCIDTPFRLSNNLQNALLEYDFIHHVAYATGILKP